MTITELITDTLFLANTVSTQYKQEAVLRNLNRYYDEAVLEIWKSDSKWRFDESLEDLPVAVGDLEEGQTNYLLPSDARQVQRVQITYDDTETWLKPITKEDIKGEITKTGKPQYYYLEGRSLFLYPQSEKDVTDGLTIYVSKSTTALAVDLENDDSPRIDSEFHRFLSIGAAYDWYFAKGNITKSRELERKLGNIRQSMKEFYSDRNTSAKSRFKRKIENYG